MLQRSDAIRDIQTIRDEDETAFWSGMDARGNEQSSSSENMTVKASILPTDVAFWLSQLTMMARQAHLDVKWRASAGHGLLVAHINGDEDVLVRAVGELRQAAATRRGSLVVLDGSMAVFQHIDVWGESPAVEVMRRIKARFDPNGLLNPGRFLGRI
jgi:glycolate oxidase FAD binding subunit